MDSLESKLDRFDNFGVQLCTEIVLNFNLRALIIGSNLTISLHIVVRTEPLADLEQFLGLYWSGENTFFELHWLIINNNKCYLFNHHLYFYLQIFLSRINPGLLLGAIFYKTDANHSWDINLQFFKMIIRNNKQMIVLEHCRPSRKIKIYHFELFHTIYIF